MTSAADWADGLLELVGASGTELRRSNDSAPISDWARSGCVPMTGARDGAPLVPAGIGATAARGALLALDAIVGPTGIAGERLLAERAAISGWQRQAPWTLGGHCRSVRASDEWLALSLAREADVETVPALVSGVLDGLTESAAWAQIDRWAATTTAAAAVDRARLLGLPAGLIGEVRERPLMTIRSTERPMARAIQDLVVIDLSSLWAGPLCGHLLGRAGAEVIRVESSGRPDGGRQGLPGFDDLLHAGQPSVAFDSQDPSLLYALVAAADIVITSARPRGLASLGLDPQAFLASKEHGVWVQVSAYGSTGEQANWVGFGDDAAMAAGLVQWIDDMPVPVADALADPLTGMHAAVAAAACAVRGGSHLIDIALADVAAATLQPRANAAPYQRAGAWWIESEFGECTITMPGARPSHARARPLGADTAAMRTRFTSAP